MLVLAGAGLGPGYQGRLLEDLVASAWRVYVDTYTMPGASWLLEWARRVARDRVVEAPRHVLEQGGARIVEEARDRLVVVLVAGDPLIATTHRSLVVEAARRGVGYRVIPGVSGVCSAKAASMLDYYKFGRTVTVPGPWRMVKAYSIVEYLLYNACGGMHTLLLLDIDGEGRQLHPGEAAGIVLSLAGELGVSSLLEGSPAILVEAAGLENGRVRVFERLSTLAAWRGGFAEPASIIVPGTLAAYEREALEAVLGLDPGPGIGGAPACRALEKAREHG